MGSGSSSDRPCVVHRGCATPIDLLVQGKGALTFIVTNIGSRHGAANVPIRGISLGGHFEDSHGLFAIAALLFLVRLTHAPGGPDVAGLLLLSGRQIGATAH